MDAEIVGEQLHQLRAWWNSSPSTEAENRGYSRTSLNHLPKALGVLGGLQLHAEVHQAQHNQLVKGEKWVIFHLCSVFVWPFLEHSAALEGMSLRSSWGLWACPVRVEETKGQPHCSVQLPGKGRWTGQCSALDPCSQWQDEWEWLSAAPGQV